MEIALERDENLSAGTGVGGAAPTPFDLSQFVHLNIDHHQHSSADVGDSGVAGTGGDSLEKNHPQQCIKLNAWQTNNLDQNLPPPQPLMMLAPQPPHQHQHQHVFQKGGFSPMGGKQQGGPRGDGGYNRDVGQLTWEERLKKAQGAKERAEGVRAEGGRQFGADASGGGTNGAPREGASPRGRGGGGRGRGRGGWNDKPRMARRDDDNAENCGGFGVQYAEQPPVEKCGGFGANANNEFAENRGGFGGARVNEYAERRGGFTPKPSHGYVEKKRGGFGDRSYGHREGGQREHRGGGGGWRGGAPPVTGTQAQQGDTGGFPMAPFGMHGVQRGRGGGGGWRGGMRGNGGFRGGGGGWGGEGGRGAGAGVGAGGGISSMQMQMRVAAAAAASGAPHPMMMRASGPMGNGGFAVMPPTPSGAMGASPMLHQEQRFRSSWYDDNMCLPTLMDMPEPMMDHHQMMGGGFGGGRGGFSSPRGGGRGTRGGYRGRVYNRDRESSPRGEWPGQRHEGEMEYERTFVDSPNEEMAAHEDHYQE